MLTATGAEVADVDKATATVADKQVQVKMGAATITFGTDKVGGTIELAGQKDESDGDRRVAVCTDERRLNMDVNIAGRKLELVEGDITEMDTDAIVNAANAQLVLGAGVAGAIRRKGGPQIQQECDRIGGTFVGGAVITTGGTLKARHVIHAVGPQMGEGDEDEKLRNATLNSLKLADEHGLKSIAFPAISTGIFGFPIQQVRRRSCSQTTVEHLRGDTGLERVVFCLFGRDSYDVFAAELQQIVAAQQ